MLHNLMKKFRSATPSQKPLSSSFVTYDTLGQPIWSPVSYTGLSREGYQRNVVIYRAVTLIARSLASVPWTLYQDLTQEIESHPLLCLLNKPNPTQGRVGFIETLVSHLLLSGNSYIEAVCPHENRPFELYCLRPDRMTIMPGSDGLPAAYEYRVDQHHRRLDVSCASEESPILHMKLFHPLNDWYGLSPLEAAAKSIDQHNSVAGHNLALMQNGGRPSGALFVKAQLSEEQRGQLREDLETTYQSVKNSGKMMILEGDFDWKEMGLSPKDLDFIEGKNLSAREMAQAFGVPPMLVGVPGDSTFSNYREARFHLWEDTILPLLDMLTNELNAWLTPRYGKNLSLKYNMDAVPALSIRRETEWNKINQCAFLTINEKRAAVGYSPIPDGDHL